MHRSTAWLWLILLLCSAGAYGAWTSLGWQEWTQSWGGSMFKLLSGAAVGLWWSRIVHGLDISSLPMEHRAEAAKSQAWVVGAFVIGAAMAV